MEAPPLTIYQSGGDRLLLHTPAALLRHAA
jgi:hypothetical protein